MKSKFSDFQLQPSQFQKYWYLDPEIVFLNHGSFGACPIAVLEAQQRFRQELEREPLRFFREDWEKLLDSARNKLAEFVGANASELVFVPNATTGVNAVLRSLKFCDDDELLTTDHEYNACRNVLDFVASQTGARVVVAKVPFPIASPQQVVEAVLEKVSSKTRLALLDHITSQTGLIFPVQEIVRELTKLGIDILIDGAHAPGMVPLNLREMGATYYSANCHKWLCAPKGAGFLYVKEEKRSLIRPTTISHGANSPRLDKSRFQLEFDWMGTHDPTAYLCVPEAIEFMGSLLAGGWTELMAKNHALAVAGRQILCEALNVAPLCPEDTIGAMAVVPLPDTLPDPEKAQLIPPVQDALFKEFGIEVPVMPSPATSKQLIRISAQVYNTIAQYEYLAWAIGKLISE